MRTPRARPRPPVRRPSVQGSATPVRGGSRRPRGHVSFTRPGAANTATLGSKPPTARGRRSSIREFPVSDSGSRHLCGGTSGETRGSRGTRNIRPCLGPNSVGKNGPDTAQARRPLGSWERPRRRGPGVPGPALPPLPFSVALAPRLGATVCVPIPLPRLTHVYTHSHVHPESKQPGS